MVQAEHPDFEQLLQIIRILTEQSTYEFCRVVLASSDGDVKFLEVTETPEFRTALAEALRDGFLALGLLGWQLDEGTLQARSRLFGRHSTPRVRELFDQLCEAGVDAVGEELESFGEGG